MHDTPVLIVITGPTASGKSALALQVAQALNTEIISADSRQIYKEIPIVTAMPTYEEREAVPHHLVDLLPLDAYYSAATFEEDAIKIANKIFTNRDVAVVCGGSMLYVDALCNGIDILPTISVETRETLRFEHTRGGDEWLLSELKVTDPISYNRIDHKNIKRIFHALEITREARMPYSELIGKAVPKHNAKIIKICLDMPRSQLFDRINHRVVKMVEAGLEEEIHRLTPLRGLNSLNTVGIKEMFDYFDGIFTLPEAIGRIQKNTRIYAKKQITWFSRDPDIIRLSPEKAFTGIMSLL